MDVIAAIATGASPTAIGIVRVSGEGSFALCDAVFRPANGIPFSAQDGRMMVFGEMLDTQGRCIDRGLAVRFPGPHSYTGEDSAEFYCHGSPWCCGSCFPPCSPPAPGRQGPENSPAGPF